MAEEVHESMQRLLQFATASTKGQRNAVVDWKTLGRRLAVSSAVMTNWKKRGISEGGALDAEAKLGCSASWLRSGRGPHVAGSTVAQSPPAVWNASAQARGATRRGAPVAHLVSQPTLSDAPLFAWEQLMKNDLPRQFRVALPDDAMAPDLNAGDEVVFDRTLTPEAGDLVLVRDKAGHHYARTYRERLHGEWIAFAENDDFEPLDARAEGLHVVAVCVMEIRHRRRS